MWPQTVGRINMKLGVPVVLVPGHIVLDGDPVPAAQKGGTAPQFSAHVYYGEAARWIKMPLGREVGLGPGDIVLDGAQSPQRKGARPPIFGRCLLWLNGRPSQLLLSSCVRLCY